MSLRDALLKAGAVNQKKVAEVNRELKHERKQAQAQRERRTVLEAEAERARAEAAERRKQEVLTARRERQAQQGAAAARLRTQQLIRRYHLRYREGPARFYHPDLGGRHLLRLDLPERLAQELRAGALAVAALQPSWGGEPDYHLIPREVALRIVEQDAGSVVFFNPQAPDPADPALQLLDEGVARTGPRWL